MNDDYWIAVVLAFVVLGSFGIGYGLSYLQWEVL